MRLGGTGLGMRLGWTGLGIRLHTSNCSSVAIATIAYVNIEIEYSVKWCIFSFKCIITRVVFHYTLTKVPILVVMVISVPMLSLMVRMCQVSRPLYLPLTV